MNLGLFGAGEVQQEHSERAGVQLQVQPQRLEVRPRPVSSRGWGGGGVGGWRGGGDDDDTTQQKCNSNGTKTIGPPSKENNMGIALLQYSSALDSSTRVTRVPSGMVLSFTLLRQVLEL